MHPWGRSIRDRAFVLAGAIVVLASLAARQAPCGPSFPCKGCTMINDTSASPGIVSLPEHFFAGQAIHPAIAFVGADHRLRCALPAATGWQIEIVDLVSEAGGLSMTLDAAGQPLISYHDGLGRLFLVHRIGIEWIQEPVDATGLVIGQTSIAAFTDGVGIAYLDADSGLVKYAERTAGGPWRPIDVAPAGGGEAYPSLVADGVERAISFYDPVAGDLRLALRDAAGGWSSQLVDGEGDVGGYTSLIGSSSVGGFGIAYYDFTNADLKYAHSVPGGWMVETIDGALATGASVGRFCSAVAFAGNPFDLVGIGYYDQSNGDLKYAFKHGPVWTSMVLDTTGNSGGSTSCGTTPFPGDTLGIAYLDRAAGNLAYQFYGHTFTAVPPVGGGSPLRVTWRRATDGSGGRVRFTLPVAGAVRVIFYDPQGRRVAMPFRGDLPAGLSEVRWDGRDDRGRRVGSGVLYVRVESAAGAGTALVILLH